MAGLDEALSKIKAIKKTGDDKKSTLPNASALTVDIAMVKPDEDQPRRTFDDGELNGLAESIKERGVLQPITVQPLKDDVYKIQMGERRYRASIIAGEKTIPILIKDVTADLRADQIIENIQRADLTTFEIANAIRGLMDDGWKGVRIAKTLGVQPAHVSRVVSILKMPEGLQSLADKNVTAHALVNLNKAWEIDRKATQKFINENDAKALTQQHSKAFVASLSETDLEKEEKPVPKELIGKTKKDNGDTRILIVKCRYEGQGAEVVLNRLPESNSNLFIKLEDGTEIEIGKGAIEFVEFDVR